MKYHQYCPRILGVNAQNTLFHMFFFFHKVERKGILHRKSTPASNDNLRKTLSKYESNPLIFATAKPDFVEAG